MAFAGVSEIVKIDLLWRCVADYKRKEAPAMAPLGAENETRTRDPDLGKVVLYQLSYFRSISKTRSRGTGLQRYGKNLNLQIFLQKF